MLEFSDSVPRGEPVASGRVGSECFPCCRIRPGVTSASRTNPFQVAIREGGGCCLAENGAWTRGMRSTYE